MKIGLSHLAICVRVGLFGQNLDKDEVIKILDDCLLTDEDMTLGKIIG